MAYEIDLVKDASGVDGLKMSKLNVFGNPGPLMAQAAQLGLPQILN
jgi:hypothetical protein